MFSYLKGIITEIYPNYIVLENNEVGFMIYVANPFSFKEGENYKVYIWTQIKEDEHNLFGFKEKEERDLFLKLLNVKGIGAKLIMPMLALGSMNGIVDAIERENILYLTKFPKIGEKLAKQIILDLKGKLSKTVLKEETHNDELISALENLGYKMNDIKRVISIVNKDNSLEEQIRESLKLLIK